MLEFRGPDAVRFLNGQLTQDVRLIAADGTTSLPSCVTDAKGKLQFRVLLTKADTDALWVSAPAGSEEALSARLTKYLIADDVEFTDLTGSRHLWHFTGTVPEPPAGVIVRKANRYGIPGTDWWTSGAVELPGDTVEDPLALEALRIANGIPAWGRELVEGLLPPEAALEDTDISYRKGCYIGQEVISRIKSAGKVNKLLTRFTADAGASPGCGPLQDAEGKPAGEITSVSPLAEEGIRHLLGFTKRGAESWFSQAADGTLRAIHRA